MKFLVISAGLVAAGGNKKRSWSARKGLLRSLQSVWFYRNRSSSLFSRVAFLHAVLLSHYAAELIVG